MERSRRAKQRQNRIIGIVVAVAAVVLLVAILVPTLIGKQPVDETLFDGGDNRLVVSMNSEMASFEDGEYEPEITRIVYYHDGNNVNKMEIYFEYATEDEAKAANDEITLDGKDWATGKRLNGRFIIFDVAAGQYQGLTVAQMQETIENMRAAGTLLEDAAGEEITE